MTSNSNKPLLAHLRQLQTSGILILIFDFLPIVIRAIRGVEITPPIFIATFIFAYGLFGILNFNFRRCDLKAFLQMPLFLLVSFVSSMSWTAAELVMLSSGRPNIPAFVPIVSACALISLIIFSLRNICGQRIKEFYRNIDIHGQSGAISASDLDAAFSLLTPRSSLSPAATLCIGLAPIIVIVGGMLVGRGAIFFVLWIAMTVVFAPLLIAVQIAHYIHAKQYLTRKYLKINW